MKVRVLIVDDESPATELLASYVTRIEDFEIIGICHNALDAFTFLQKNPVDLVFLDIQMPRMSGLELVRSLPEKPAVIFTTAYREYGVDGFELDALDYLVKPITFDRFLKAIAKFNQQVVMKKGIDQTHENNAFDKAYMYFKVNRDLVKIYLKDIVYIESIRDYVKIITDNRSIITYQRISFMEEKLPEHKFLRIHKSYIVALDKITGFSNDCVSAGTFSLPVGRSYKPKFMQYIEGGV
jgi:DNA-binding LytR/AlgR family response regulator